MSALASSDRIPREARLTDDADWLCEPPDFAELGQPHPRFSWLHPSILWQSRNNVLAGLFGDPTEDARRAWVRAQRKRLIDSGAPPVVADDFTIVRPDLEDFSFLLMGDTGEGDTSQYAIVPQMLAAAEGTEFAVIASDVVYPAGDVNEYIVKFFTPYAGYPKPIYGVPGNHDWLDGLAGFMRHFCGVDPPPEKLVAPPTQRYPHASRLLHRLLWRRPRDLQPGTLERAKQLRGAATASGPLQPNMYFAIDTPRLRIICIDTGILGRIDHAQGEWLKRVSAGPKAKLIVAGKPIYGNGVVSPRRILPPEGQEWNRKDTILNLVSDPANNFVGLINGDLHNYQRYPVRTRDGRLIEFIVSGGGGAFMSSTHTIPRVDLPGVTEDEVVFFPTRGDSLRAFSIMLLRRVRWWTPGKHWRSVVRGIPADQAAAIVARRIGIDEPGLAEVKVSWRSRLLASLVFPRRALLFEPSRIAEILDWDDPPFYKSFLRLDIAGGRLKITAFGASGCRDTDAIPIDHVEIEL
ncbi:MAG TPA: metallophosphoesterase family protein [Solirubrobacterales bacterium]|nr:metallophosphoesterase family protein [Solirubrobacterales bacterium]